MLRRERRLSNALVAVSWPWLVPFLSATAVEAQTIAGRVIDAASGGAVFDAIVTATSADGRELGSVRTDSAGKFLIRSFRAGSFLVRVQHAAYGDHSARIDIGLGERVDLTIPLQISPTVLDSIPVTARSRLTLPDMGYAGFEERRRWGELLGVGRYLGPAELTGGRIETMLAAVSGIRLVTHPICPDIRILVSGRTTANFRSMTRAQMPCSELTPDKEVQLGICRLTFIVDGVRVALSGSERIDDLVQSSLVAGIEVYRTPAELPAEYSGYNSRCGVVAIWTKRR